MPANTKSEGILPEEGKLHLVCVKVDPTQKCDMGPDWMMTHKAPLLQVDGGHLR